MRRTASIGLALLVALIGAVAVVSYANKADARATAGQKVRNVYIVAERVPQGTTEKSAVAQGLITRQRVVAKGVPSGALTSVSSKDGTRVALTDIDPGEVVLAARFGAPDQVQATSGVPSGKVAITVGLSEPAAIKPLLVKGSHIALYDTFNARGKSAPFAPYGAHLNDDKPTIRATGVVLPDVVVISVTTPKSSAGASGSSSPGGGALLVTVAVSPQDSVRLVQAIQTGDIYAALLGSGSAVAPGASSSDNDVVGP